MEIKKPVLQQLTTLVNLLRQGGYIGPDVDEGSFDNISEGQYRFLLALFYNNKKDKLSDILDQILNRNNN